MLSQTLNTRDLGGYTTQDQHTTAYHVFVRSDKLRVLDSEDLALLHSWGVTTIVDLRNDRELADCPCALCNEVAFNYRHCKMFGDGNLPDSPQEVGQSYFTMVDEQCSIRAIWEVLLQAKGCVLFHCSAGKDRTGILSALLLLLAGVPHEDIVADYIATQAFLFEMLQSYCQKHQRNLQLVTPKAEYMREFLKLFHQKYHTIENYLLTIGISSTQIESIKRRFVVM